MTRQDAAWLFVSRGAVYGPVCGAATGGGSLCAVALVAFVVNGPAYLRVSVPLGLALGAGVGYLLGRRAPEPLQWWVAGGATVGCIVGVGPEAFYGIALLVLGGIYGGLTGFVTGVTASLTVSAFVALRHLPLVDPAACRREVAALAILAGFAVPGPALILLLTPDSSGPPTPAGLLWMAGLGLLGAPWGGWACRRAVDGYIADSKIA